MYYLSILQRWLLLKPTQPIFIVLQVTEILNDIFIWL